MKKLFLSLLVALCAAGAVLGIAACNEATGYNITVSCGDGGGYSLSHENPVPENTQVTLTVTPDDGYTVGDVLIDNSKVSLIGNRYIFTVTKDVSISVNFEEEVIPCSVTVDCGAGGSYELFPASGFCVGETVTLTLTPDAGYRAGEVKVNGTAVTLNGNEYEWTLEGDTAVEIDFAPIPYSVTVNCGYGGNYELSKQAPYTYGDEVTLTVTTDGTHAVKSLIVNGADVTEELAEGEYTFTVSSNVEIVVSFSAIVSRAAYVGTWTSAASAGTLSDVLVIGASSFTFNDMPYPLIATETGFTFTVTASGEVTRYTITLEEVGEEKYVLILTATTTDAVFTEYCTKEGVDYSVSFPEELWGDWDAGPSRYPVAIDDTALTIDGEKTVVLFYNEQTKTYMLLSGSTQYTLVWNEADGTFTLTAVGDPSSAAVYSKAAPLVEHFFTEFAGNFYTNGAHSVQIGEDGSFTFDGTLCHVFPIDSSGQMKGYNFKRGSKLWQLFSVTETAVEISDYSDTITCYKLTGEEAYTLTVTSEGEGTYEVSPPKNGGETYGGYEKVTITLSPAEGYRLNKLLVNGTDVAWEVTDNSYSFYISENSTVEISFISENTHEPLFPDSYYDYKYTGTTTVNKPVTLEFSRDGTITITLDGVVYTGQETDIVLNQGKKSDFTVYIEGLGNVRFLYYGVYRGYFDLNCDKFNANMDSRVSVPKA